jgi:hypothetical protein
LPLRRRESLEQGFGQSNRPAGLRHAGVPRRAFGQQGAIGFSRDPVSEKQLSAANFLQ